jgi:hypothetical protein
VDAEGDWVLSRTASRHQRAPESPSGLVVEVVEVRFSSHWRSLMRRQTTLFGANQSG